MRCPRAREPAWVLGLRAEQRTLNPLVIRWDSRRASSDLAPARRWGMAGVFPGRRGNRDTPLTLPFFSLVSLRAAAARLAGYGFRVSIAAVQEPSQAAGSGVAVRSSGGLEAQSPSKWLRQGHV